MFWLRNKKNNFQLRTLILGTVQYKRCIFARYVPMSDSAKVLSSSRISSSFSLFITGSVV